MLQGAGLLALEGAVLGRVSELSWRDDDVSG